MLSTHLCLGQDPFKLWYMKSVMNVFCYSYCIIDIYLVIDTTMSV